MNSTGNTWLPLLAFLAVVGFSVSMGLIFHWWKKRKIKSISSQPLSPDRQTKLRANVPLVEKLSSDQFQRLQTMMQVFQLEKSWEACGGLPQVTQEMKDAVSAHACLLILENGLPNYPRLRSLLLYPAAYTAQMRDEAASTRLGESWDRGSVVLSWQGVQSSGRDDRDAFNLAIHELAHQLDQANGRADGVPVLGSSENYAAWAQAFSAAYQDFCDDINAKRSVLLDEYGATNEAEFFAVASETYFERPDRLEKAYPEVFALMKEFYRISL